MWQSASISNSNRRFFRADPQGSIIALTDQNGAVVDTYTYDAYGNPDDPTGQPIRYTGRRWDAETGLYYYRARMYNPALGRFLQTDLTGYDADNNLYAYANHDPINFSDATGLAPDFIMDKRNAAVVSFAKANPAVASTVADFLPIIGDIKGIAEAIVDPSALNIVLAVVTLVPGTDFLKGLKGVGKGADNAADSVKLNKKLTSDEQVAQLQSGGGTEIAGGNSGKTFKDADRVAAQNGGNAGDFSKVKSDARVTSDGTQIQTTGNRNNVTGEVVEMKTIITPCKKGSQCK